VTFGRSVWLGRWGEPNVREARHHDLIVFVWDDDEIGNRAPVAICCTARHQVRNPTSIGRHPFDIVRSPAAGSSALEGRRRWTMQVAELMGALAPN